MQEINTQIAIDALLTQNGLTVEDLEESFKKLDGHHIDYADFYFQKILTEGYILEEKIIKAGSFHIDTGVGVRAVSGSKSALAYSDEISRDALISAAQTVKSIGESSDSDIRVHLKSKECNHHLYTGDNPIEQTDTHTKIQLLQAADLFARSRSPLVKQVSAHISSSFETVLIAGSDGRLIGDIRPLIRFEVSVIVEKDGMHQNGHAGGGGRFTLDYFNEDIIRSYAEEAVDSAVRNLSAKPSPAGVMPVVLANGWPGILLHEAVGHGLEGDFHRKETSVFSDLLGKQVASRGVTVVDDGTIPNRRGSLNVDDEGNPTARNVLIEDGILVGLLQDELNARLMHTKPTGNGRRESFAYLPLPRMTNTFMENGQSNPDDIIASLDYGIYAKNFGGGQVDITNGKFVFSMRDAWLVEKGKLTYPIKGAMLIGSGAEALTHIQMIGNDCSLDPGVGVCGKDGQSVPVGVGMPTVLIDGLTVGGTQS